MDEYKRLFEQQYKLKFFESEEFIKKKDCEIKVFQRDIKIFFECIDVCKGEVVSY